MRVAEARRRNPKDLEGLPLWSEMLGRSIRLSQVATIEPSFEIRGVRRWNREREAFVRADLTPGADLLGVVAEIESWAEVNATLPPGYRLSFQGQREEVAQSFTSLARAGVAAIFLVYLVLVMRFGSLLQPLSILLSIPMAWVGTCLGLAATGNPLSFTAILGFVSLIGIAVNDSILVIHSINRSRELGQPIGEAVCEGASKRLRAVLMTSATTIFGMIPLAVGGGAFWSPFASAMIFGLLASTVQTLVLQPAAYLTLASWTGRRNSQA